MSLKEEPENQSRSPSVSDSQSVTRAAGEKFDSSLDRLHEKSTTPPDQTRVDMGEDLLLEDVESHKSSEQNPLSGPPVVLAQSGSIEEELANGRILINEGLLEEAKKVLRGVLRRDARQTLAKQLLDEIYKREIQELLAPADVAKQALHRVGFSEAEGEGSDQIEASLNADLRLNLQRAAVQAVPDLFADREQEDRFSRSVLVSLGWESALTEEERRDIAHTLKDLGVAFMEMGLFHTAGLLFESLERVPEFHVEAIYLHASSLIEGENYVEATIRLEPVLRDLTLGEGRKADFLYLMGVAFLKLGDNKKAKEYFRKVFSINPRYRDVAERVR